MQVAGLLKDNLAAARGGAEDREVAVRRHLLHGLRSRLVGEDVELAAAIGAEVHRAPEPHGIRVVRSRGRLRDFLELAAGRVVDPDAGHRAAAIFLPLLVPARDRVVGDASARSLNRIGDVRNRHQLLHAARDRNLEELRVAIGEYGASGREQDGGAVRRERLDLITAWMPGEPRGDASLHRDDVDVRVAFVLRAERNQLSVRRKRRVRFLSVIGRQTPHAGAVETGHPEISGVDERHVVGADCRLSEQPGVVDVHRRNKRWINRRRDPRRRERSSAGGDHCNGHGNEQDGQ